MTSLVDACMRACCHASALSLGFNYSSSSVSAWVIWSFKFIFADMSTVALVTVPHCGKASWRVQAFKCGTQGKRVGSICSSNIVTNPGVQHAGDCLLRASV
jgi:hypothetical protein